LQNNSFLNSKIEEFPAKNVNLFVSAEMTVGKSPAVPHEGGGVRRGGRVRRGGGGVGHLNRPRRMAVGTWVTGRDRIGLKDYQGEGGRGGGAGGLNTVPQVPGHRQLTITAHLPLLICMWEKRNEGLCLCKETFMKPI
jgi:hypothetical protein